MDYSLPGNNVLKDHSHPSTETAPRHWTRAGPSASSACHRGRYARAACRRVWECERVRVAHLHCPQHASHGSSSSNFSKVVALEVVPKPGWSTLAPEDPGQERHN